MIDMGDMVDTSGKYLTLALFWEHRHPKYIPTFTVKDRAIERDGVSYPSLKEIYLEYSDPTEYIFATEVFGSWPHWQMICESYNIRPVIAKWRAELEVKLKAEALRSMIDSAKNDGSKGLTAAKYIAEKGWEKKRGRPSKEDIARERKMSADVSKEIEDDIARMEMH